MQEQKSIEQLLELSQNQYYVMTNEERQRLDDFLLGKSGQQNQQKDSGNGSESNTHATVVKNVPQKHDGTLPTSDQVAKADNQDPQ